MNLIMVLYGVGESKELIASLKKRGYQVAAVVQTEYGGQAAESSGADRVFSVLPGNDDISKLIQTLGIKLMIDATHPFVNPLSTEAQEKSLSFTIPYIRFGRSETNLPQNSLIHRVNSWEKAAETASSFNGTIFLTTGSHNLDVFTKCKDLSGRRIVVRVLPDPRILRICQEQGIIPRDIVAMQGPFSVKLNKAIFQAYRTGVVVTRDGGLAGGTYNKVNAALNLKIPVVLIQREKLVEKNCLLDLDRLLENVARNYR